MRRTQRRVTGHGPKAISGKGRAHGQSPRLSQRFAPRPRPAQRRGAIAAWAWKTLFGELREKGGRPAPRGSPPAPRRSPPLLGVPPRGGGVPAGALRCRRVAGRGRPALAAAAGPLEPPRRAPPAAAGRGETGVGSGPAPPGERGGQCRRRRVIREPWSPSAAQPCPQRPRGRGARVPRVLKPREMPVPDCAASPCALPPAPGPRRGYSPGRERHRAVRSPAGLAAGGEARCAPRRGAGLAGKVTAREERAAWAEGSSPRRELFVSLNLTFRFGSSPADSVAPAPQHPFLVNSTRSPGIELTQWKEKARTNQGRVSTDKRGKQKLGLVGKLFPLS